MTKESIYQKKLIDYITSLGGYIVKFNASGMSRTGVP